MVPVGEHNYHRCHRLSLSVGLVIFLAFAHGSYLFTSAGMLVCICILPIMMLVMMVMLMCS